MIDLKATPSLYDITGDIKDINTLLVPKQLLEAAEKDAARYQWLRDTGDETWVPLKSRLRGSNKAEAHIDAAIAAARKEQK